jgi:hypothetical protein
VLKNILKQLNWLNLLKIKCNAQFLSWPEPFQKVIVFGQNADISAISRIVVISSMDSDITV